MTIAHQDDLYRKDYVKMLLEAGEKYPDVTLFTGGYRVLKNGRPVRFEKVEFVKRFLRLPLRLPRFAHLSWVKKSVLIFGNAICCPACTYHKEILGEPFTVSPYRFALDWDTLLSLAGRPGRFVCTEDVVLYYRVHQEAATKACIADHSRFAEEWEIFSKIWPGPLVRVLMYFYRKAYEEYEE